jgi:hypothetical protein
MTNSEKYNGWTNYATWRVNLEIFDGYDPDGRLVCPFELQDYAEEIIEGQAEARSLALDYAMAFLAAVNWCEIARHINETHNSEEVA